MISKDFLYLIVIDQDLDSEIPPIESVAVVSEFPEVFPNDLIDIFPDGKLILVSIFYQ